MAKMHYSADSAPLPPPRLMLFQIWPETAGSGPVPAFHGGIAPSGAAFPITPSHTV
jgi:hypothetical protein